MSMAATATALGTVELLERILLYLPMLEIIRGQNVSKAWHDCVRDSIQIQRKLFMAPIDSTKVPRVRKYGKYMVQPVKTNPLLANIFRVRHSEISGSTINLKPVRGKRRLQQSKTTLENVLAKKVLDGSLDDVDTRPVLLDNEDFYKVPDTSYYFRGYYDAHDWALRSTRAERHFPRSYVFSEKWSAMLLTQPPLKSVSIRALKTEARMKARKLEATDGVGVRLGELAEAVAEMYRTADRPEEVGYDVETEVFQSLEIHSPTATASAPVSYVTEGMRHTVEKGEDVGFLRAWKTRVKCDLG